MWQLEATQGLPFRLPFGLPFAARSGQVVKLLVNLDLSLLPRAECERDLHR